MAPKAQTNFAKPKSSAYKDKTKPADVRLSNIQAAKGNGRIWWWKFKWNLLYWFLKRVISAEWVLVDSVLSEI